MNFSLQPFDFTGLKTSPTLQTVGLVIRVNVWKDLKTACLIIFPLPLEFPALETKQVTWIGQLSCAEWTCKYEGECPVGLAGVKKKTKKKKSLLVGKHVSRLKSASRQPGLQLEGYQNSICFFSLNFGFFSNVLFLGFNFWFDLLFQGNSPEVYFHGFPSLFSVSK